jgi:hypothetical protein
VEHDLLENRALPVHTRFELAIRRMTEAWLAAGRVRVSAGDVKLAREYLEQSGCKVEDAAEARLRLFNPDGRPQEMTREALVMAAFRRLTNRHR